MAQVLFQADNVSLYRSGQCILDSVSLTVKEHDFLTILGPNGAGKSTLLHVLLGFKKPSSGRVHRRDNLRLGYVPQKLVLDKTMPITVDRFLSLHTPADSTSIRSVSQDLGIDKQGRKSLHNLSSGELQRVLLARALLNNPQVLILDEPAQNMDINNQLIFYRLLEEVYKQRQMSVLMVSHDLYFVMSLTKHVVCLSHHVCCSGEPHSVASTSEFTDLFGPEVARILAFYQHDQHHHLSADRHAKHPPR